MIVRRPCLSARVISLFVIFTMFSNGALASTVGPEAVTAVKNVGNRLIESLDDLNIGSLLAFTELPRRKASAKNRPAETTIDRIVIQQGDVSVVQGEDVDYVATAYFREQPVGGVLFRWTIRKADSGETRSLLNGHFQTAVPGSYVIRASYGGYFAEGNLTVSRDPAFNVSRLLRIPERERTPAQQKQVAEWIASGLLTVRPISSRDIRPISVDKSRSRPAPKQNVDVNRIDSVDPIGWDTGNYATADDPINWVGRPIGSASHKGAANGNYNLSIPAVNLDGRGDLDINLNLEYNSRLWSKSGSEVTYNADSGYPAPGWNLGFGKMFYMGDPGGCMLVAPDGTRRSYDGGNTVYNSGGVYTVTFNGWTTDGSFTEYGCYYYSSSSTTYLTGWAKLPNGTTMTFGASTGSYDQIFPTLIKDAHGNYINVSYLSGAGPSISTITDTLGRTITFNYNGTALRSISGPGYGGTTRYFIRFEYFHQTINTTNLFSGLTVNVANSTPYQLKAIFYPTTNNGYWFCGTTYYSPCGTDAYSPYGILRTIKSQRGMTWNSGPDTIDWGTTNRDEVYNFTTTADSLTDSPGYSTHTETFDGIDTSSLVTSYSKSTSGSEETITVTRPDTSKVIQKSHVTGTYTNGLLFENRIENSSSTVLDKTVTTLASGAWSSPRPSSIERTDDKNQVTKTEFTYGSVYNQVTAQKEYDYGGTTLYREKRFTYQNNSAYTSRNIFNLVTSVEDYDNSNGRLTRTVYTYDGTTPVAASGIVQHDYTFDPHTTETVNGTTCAAWTPDGAGCSYDGEWVFHNGNYYTCACSTWDQVSAYNSANDARGNLTNVTTYTDGTNATGAISYDFTYDISGNERTSTTNCCQQIGSSYSTATQYLLPDSVTKGSSNPSSPDRITQSFSYDSNTKLPTTIEDYNGLDTTITYDAAYRPTLVTLNSGGKKTTTYNDSSLNRNEHVQLANNTTVSNSSLYFNGRGQVTKSTYQAGASNHNATSVQYDTMGRQWKISRPYDSGSSPSYWTTLAYDSLGRPTTQTGPDSSVRTMTYNGSAPSSASSNAGQTVITTDAWGRERWVRYDAFGRLVEAVEPNPADTGGDVHASGNINTTYAYDRLDRLTTVTQGSQTRSFKFDSLGRMTRQKLAEQVATINDSGVYNGTGTLLWSDSFTYDSRSNLIQRMDARGAITTFDYTVSSSPDPLNRLQSISGSLASGVSGIDLAPTVTMEYMTTGDKTRVKKVTTSGVAVEESTFDGEGRVSEYKVVFDGRTSYPIDTDYTYDTAHRLTQIDYPKLYGLSGDPKRAVVPSYDQASRLNQLNVDGTTRLGNVTYNVSGQITELMTAPSANNGKTENYTYDAQTGLLTGQTLKKVNTSTTYMDLTYSYARGNSYGSSSGKTGQVTEIVDNQAGDRTRKFEFDALARLRVAKGGLAAGATGVTADWSQTYAYDRYGNRNTTTPSGVDWDNVSVPADGIGSLSHTPETNRISTSGWTYDSAGNLTRGQNASGTWQKYKYDSAGRLIQVLNDSDVAIETYTYGASRQRLKTETSSQRTYYAWGGSKVLVEYTEATSSSTPAYSKVYYYAGERLVSSNENGSSLDFYHHPDRLGTKVVSNSFSSSLTRQATFPFGTDFPSEGSGAPSANNLLFTSYDRSSNTGLDYAINRTYSSGQSRFTQVDPIGMAAASIGNPQSNNLYAYVQNMPSDFVDPSGLLMMVCMWIGWQIDTPGNPRVYVCRLIPSGGGNGGTSTTPTNGGETGGSTAPQGKCPVKPLSPITDPEAQRMEGGDRVIMDKLAPETQDALRCLQENVTPSLRGIAERNVRAWEESGGFGRRGFNVESAYRPTAYQQHFYEIYSKSKELKKYGRECDSVRQQVERERRDHELGGIVAQSNSRHSSGNGFDMSIYGYSQGQITRFATACGLKRLVGIPGEETHFHRQ